MGYTVFAKYVLSIFSFSLSFSSFVLLQLIESDDVALLLHFDRSQADDHQSQRIDANRRLKSTEITIARALHDGLSTLFHSSRRAVIIQF